MGNNLLRGVFTLDSTANNQHQEAGKKDENLSFQMICNANIDNHDLQDKYCGSFLVDGYMRQIQYELSYIIPIEIVIMISSYFPEFEYKAYGVGTDRFCELGSKYNSWHTISTLTLIQSINKALNGDTLLNIYAGFHKYFLKTQNNHIYAAGFNANRCLGLESSPTSIPYINKDAVPEFCKVNTSNIDNEDIIDFISDGLTAHHTFIVTKKNKIFAWGTNFCSQFGNNEESSSTIRIPTFYKELNTVFQKQNVKIISIACGSSHSLFLADIGRVFSCGSNSKRQCGLYKTYIKKPEIIRKLSNILAIACGSEFSLCLSKEDTNNLWCFGNNMYGCLGLGHNDSVTKPTLNPFFKQIKVDRISCGHSHSLCITRFKKCYGFGHNGKGQICNDNKYDREKIYTTPKLFDFLLQVKNGWCGSHHTIILTVEDELKFYGLSHTVDHSYRKTESLCRVVAGWNNAIIITLGEKLNEFIVDVDERIGDEQTLNNVQLL